MVAVCAVATFTARAHAVSFEDPPSMKVGYSDLNLTTQRGKDALLRRIQWAADLVCGVPGARAPAQSASYRKCVTSATEGALSQVNWPRS
jgi:UrcA family protein